MVSNGNYKTEVVHVETDTADEYTAKITVRRYPGRYFYEGTVPHATDVPQDILDALTEWIGPL